MKSIIMELLYCDFNRSRMKEILKVKNKRKEKRSDLIGNIFYGNTKT